MFPLPSYDKSFEAEFESEFFVARDEFLSFIIICLLKEITEFNDHVAW